MKAKFKNSERKGNEEKEMERKGKRWTKTANGREVKRQNDKREDKKNSTQGK